MAFRFLRHTKGLQRVFPDGIPLLLGGALLCTAQSLYAACNGVESVYSGETLESGRCASAVSITLENSQVAAQANLDLYAPVIRLSPTTGIANVTSARLIALKPSVRSVDILEGQSADITLTGSASYTHRLSEPAHGVLSGTHPDLVYTPNSSFIGSDSFNHLVDAGSGTPSLTSYRVQVRADYLDPPANLDGLGSKTEIQFSWDPVSGMSGGDYYQLYLAAEPIGDIGTIDVGTLAEGQIISPVTSPHTVTGLTTGNRYHAIVSVLHLADSGIWRETPSQEIAVTLRQLSLNDTGIVHCANLTGAGLTCPQSGFPGQDGEQGNDTAGASEDGHAGFRFVKIDSTGQALDSTAIQWSCVEDRNTGLIWMTMDDSGGLRDRDNRYSWYSSDNDTNGGGMGDADSYGDVCSGYSASDSTTWCNTQTFVDRVNTAGLCGASD
jgi:hypothetical protein